MEDAHVVVMQDSWGFLGVLDGHGGSQCSAAIAGRLTQELEANGKPEDDETVTNLALKLDKEYLDEGQPSGSTATFVIVTLPTPTSEGKYDLRVGNIGDSRVLLGHADGTMVEGEGTDGCLTTDHKPDHPSERERIERCGGTVQEVMGVFRVNGDLAVSRAFGDSQYKQTGGPDQRDHPVVAAPEHTRHECTSQDFLILVCDGISESNFPNREVVQLAAEELKRAGEESPDGTVDPGIAAAAVVRKALERGSKDNLSCMIVLFGPGEPFGKEKEIQPGAVDSLNHDGFRKAYEAMAAHVGMTLPEAVEARYTYLQEQKENSPELKQELTSFNGGPPEEMQGEERTQWFIQWVQTQSEASAGDGNDRMASLMRDPNFLEMAQQQWFQQDKIPDKREPVVAAGEEELRTAIQEHFALQWDSRYLSVCGKEGIILKRDDSDNTSQVRFYMNTTPMTAWFPNETLKPPRVRVAALDELRTAMEEHSHAEVNETTQEPVKKVPSWDEAAHAKLQGSEGWMLKIDDTMEAALVRFPETEEEVWLPRSSVGYDS